MKNILITGGAGFVGHHLTNKLLKEKKNKVIIVDNKSNANTNFINEFEDFKNSFSERAVFIKRILDNDYLIFLKKKI